MIYGAFCFPAFSKEELSFGIKLSHISYELCSSCKPRVKPENVWKLLLMCFVTSQKLKSTFIWDPGSKWGYSA